MKKNKIEFIEDVKDIIINPSKKASKKKSKKKQDNQEKSTTVNDPIAKANEKDNQEKSTTGNDPIVNTNENEDQISSDNNNKSNKSNDELVVKTGASDLRRQEKTLSSLINTHYEEGVKTDVTYAFCNSARNTIKLMTVDEKGDILLVKAKTGGQYQWPEYKEKGKEGYTLTLKGERKNQFLDTIGSPGI